MNQKTTKIIILLPIVAFIMILLLLVIPFTRSLGFWLLKENNPIEILSFIIFLLGSFYGFYFCYKISKLEKIYVTIFYGFFSFCLFLLAMEEISWGQWLLYFETPDTWKDINLQGETNFHNIGFMQTHSDTLHLIFGLAGLLGILLRNHPMFIKLGAPLILASWFLIIIIQSLADIIVDIVTIKKILYYIAQRTSEFIELIIAGVSFLYLYINSKRLINNKIDN